MMTKYKIDRSSRFKREYRLAKKRGYDIALLFEVIEILADGKPLPAKYKDHALSGKWSGNRECHITPDWLLIYQIKDDVLILVLVGTGTHSDLFK